MRAGFFWLGLVAAVWVWVLVTVHRREGRVPPMRPSEPLSNCVKLTQPPPVDFQSETAEALRVANDRPWLRSVGGTGS